MLVRRGRQGNIFRPPAGIWPLRLVALVAVLAAVPGELAGQALRFPTTEAEQDTAQSAVPQRPTAIPVSEIPLRADDAFARMRVLDTQMRTDPDVQYVEEDLPGELSAISAAHRRLGQVVLEQLSIRELQVLTDIWRGHENRLTGWERTFDHEWVELQSAGTAIATIRATWEVTRDSARADAETPQEVLDRIGAVIEMTDRLEAEIRDELKYLLGLETKLNDALAGVREVLRELEDAQTSVRGRLFHQNQAPLWRLAGDDEVRASERAARLWKADWEATRAFLEEDQVRLFVFLLLFVLLVVGAVRLRSRIESEAVRDDETLRSAAETLGRPISAALLLVIIFANAIFPRAPVNVWEIVAVVSVVPLYRLLPASGTPLVNRTVRLLLVLFAVAAIVELVLPHSLEYSIITLVLGLAVVVGAVGLLRGADREKVRQSAWGRLVWHGLRVSVVFAGFAVAIGVLGWSLLAEMLVFGLVYSSYLALGLVVGYRVLAGIVRLLPHSSIGRSSRILSSRGDLITERVVRLLKIGAALLWAWLTLELIYLAGPAYRWLEGIFTGSVSVGIIEVSLGRVLGFLAIILLTVWVARFIRFVLDEEVLPRLRLKRGVGNAISTIVQWTILGLGLLTAAGALGLGAQQLAIIAGALGVGIGFGLQSIVNNFVSGLILIFEQPVKVGDKVEITHLALTGEVRRIGIRSSIVRSFDGAEVIVPNANLISSEVVNWTLSDQRRRIHTEVGVAYGTDPHLVRQILAKVAADHPDVLRYPEPQVLFLGFGPNSLDFRLLSWTANFDEYLRLRSELAVATHDALQEADITIPFPQRDVHVKSLPSDPITKAADVAD